jgi:hypothetical protein
MKKALPFFLVAMGLLGWSASAADFNLVAYTGQYVPGGGGTIANLAPIDGPVELVCNETTGFCEGGQYEIFLYISTDRGTKGVAGIDFSDPDTQDTGGTSDPGSRPSGIFADGLYTSINNSAYSFTQTPPWNKVDDQANAETFDALTFGYSAVIDTFYMTPFGQFVLGAVQEDPTPPPSGDYAGQFYKGVGLQWNSTDGYTDEFLGAGGNLVPYLHLVVNVGEIPCGETGSITIQGLPGTVEGGRPDSIDWLGNHWDQIPGAKWVPTGTIDFYCVPEPASIALLALAGVPALIRRRK